MVQTAVRSSQSVIFLLCPHCVLLLIRNYSWSYRLCSGLWSCTNVNNINEWNIKKKVPNTSYIHTHPLLSSFCIADPAIYLPCGVHSSICGGFSLTDNSFSIITVWLGHNSCAPLSIISSCVSCLSVLRLVLKIVKKKKWIIWNNGYPMCL